MKLNPLFQSLLLTGSVTLLLSIPALSEEVQVREEKEQNALTQKGTKSSQILPSQTSSHPDGTVKKIQQLREIELPLRTAQKLVQAPAKEVVAVTGVKLTSIDGGIEVILETTQGEKLQPVNRSEGNTFIVDIPNAQLRLPTGNEFRQDNPVSGVTSVSVTNLDANTIRVSVTGATSQPSVKLFESNQALIFSATLTPASPSTPQQPEKPQQPETEKPSSETQPSQPTTESDPDIELIVTATRTEERVTDIARTTTVITREEIERQTAVSRRLGDILSQKVPGFAPSTNINRDQTLRGRPYGLLIDGVPQQSNSGGQFLPNLSTISPENIERIEVVSGPTAIYGQGGTGGIINIITRRPTEDELAITTEIGFSAAASGDAFFDDDGFGYNFAQSVSGTQGKFDFIASVATVFTNGFFDAEGNLIPSGNLLLDDTTTLSVLGKVGVNFDSQQRLQLAINHTNNSQDFNSIPDRSILAIDGTQRVRATRGEVEYENADDPGSVATNIDLTYTHRNLFGSQLQATAYYRQSKYVERVLFDDRGGFFDLISRATLPNEEVYGGRLQIETPLFNDRVSLLWGADYSHEDNPESNPEVFDPEVFDASGGRIGRKIGQLGTLSPAYELDSLGLFAQLKWDVSENFILSGGVRYDRFDISVDDYTPLFDSNFERYSGPPIEGGDLNFDDTTFNVGVVYKIRPEISLFANFAQGFSIPEFGQIAGFPPPTFTAVSEDFLELQPQKVDNYEIGIRGVWRNVQASLAAFYNYSPLGDSISVEETGSFIVRAPQRNYGLEATLDVQPGGGFSLGGTFSYLIGEVDEDDDGDFRDLTSFTIPPWKLTAYIEHQTTPGWLNRLQALYVGDRERGFEDGNDPVPIEGYFLVDYISSIKLGNGTLQIGIQNLFNNKYQSVRTQILAGFDEIFNYFDRGRSLSINYRITW
jgi:iron complex outermembrane receptor protein